MHQSGLELTLSRPGKLSFLLSPSSQNYRHVPLGLALSSVVFAFSAWLICSLLKVGLRPRISSELQYVFPLAYTNICLRYLFSSRVDAHVFIMATSSY